MRIVNKVHNHLIKPKIKGHLFVGILNEEEKKIVDVMTRNMV